MARNRYRTEPSPWYVLSISTTDAPKTTPTGASNATNLISHPKALTAWRLLSVSGWGTTGSGP